jgi:hypothetical protein
MRALPRRSGGSAGSRRRRRARWQADRRRRRVRTAKAVRHDPSEPPGRTPGRLIIDSVPFYLRHSPVVVDRSFARNGEPVDAHIVQIETSVSSEMVARVKAALAAGLAGESGIDPRILKIPGMSGRCYRHFINNLIRTTPDARYLEVIESDFRAVDFSALGKFNIYLFDGPHEYQDQYDGLDMALPALEDQFVLIVDDWNWEKVREGTRRAMQANRISPLYSVEIRSTLDNSHPIISCELSDWHNGYFFCVAGRDG